jgi:hypothetical protein
VEGGGGVVSGWVGGWVGGGRGRAGGCCRRVVSAAGWGHVRMEARDKHSRASQKAAFAAVDCLEEGKHRADMPP